MPGCLPQQLYKISRPMDTICPSVDTKCPPIRVKASCVPTANKQNNRMSRLQTRPPVPQTSESAVSQVSEPAWPLQTPSTLNQVCNRCNGFVTGCNRSQNRISINVDRPCNRCNRSNLLLPLGTLMTDYPLPTLLLRVLRGFA